MFIEHWIQLLKILITTKIRSEQSFGWAKRTSPCWNPRSVNWLLVMTNQMFRLELGKRFEVAHRLARKILVVVVDRFEVVHRFARNILVVVMDCFKVVHRLARKALVVVMNRMNRMLSVESCRIWELGLTKKGLLVLLFRKLDVVRVLRYDSPVGVKLPAVIGLDRVDTRTQGQHREEK